MQIFVQSIAIRERGISNSYNRSEGKLNFKKLQQYCISSLLTVLNNFIENRLTAKSKELTLDFGKKTFKTI